MNAPANLNEEYHVALLRSNFKNEFMPNKLFDFHFVCNLYDDHGVVFSEKKVNMNGNCLNAKDVYIKFISEINELSDSVGDPIIKMKESNDGVLTLICKRKLHLHFHVV